MFSTITSTAQPPGRTEFNIDNPTGPHLVFQHIPTSPPSPSYAITRITPALYPVSILRSRESPRPTKHVQFAEDEIIHPYIPFVDSDTPETPGAITNNADFREQEFLQAILDLVEYDEPEPQAALRIWMEYLMCFVVMVLGLWLWITFGYTWVVGLLFLALVVFGML